MFQTKENLKKCNENYVTADPNSKNKTKNIETDVRKKITIEGLSPIDIFSSYFKNDYNLSFEIIPSNDICLPKLHLCKSETSLLEFTKKDINSKADIFRKCKMSISQDLDSQFHHSNQHRYNNRYGTKGTPKCQKTRSDVSVYHRTQCKNLNDSEDVSRNESKALSQPHYFYNVEDNNYYEGNYDYNTH